MQRLLTLKRERDAANNIPKSKQSRRPAAQSAYNSHHPKRYGCTSSAERAGEAVLYEKAFANKNGGGDGPCLEF